MVFSKVPKINFMKTALPLLRTLLTILVLFIMTPEGNAQALTEFAFKNPVLISGVADQDGAVYKFKNVAPGVDATVTIIGRSGPEVVLDTIDIAPGGGMGYDKALQPQLGIHGTVAPYSNWWMKFQVNFMTAGKNNAVSITNFLASAIDVDGDNVAIAENIKMFQANAVTTSIASVLTNPLPQPVICPKDHVASLSADCPDCSGRGFTVKSNGTVQDCSTCNNTGKLFAVCRHPWAGSDLMMSGTTFNAVGIDTLAINNMATFSYANTDQVTFSYGGTTGAIGSTAGQRLNSLWFKSFDYSLSSLLPVKLQAFTATPGEAGVNLKWTTSNEISFNYFELERSTDGKTFEECAVVFGAENTTSTINYNYIDKNVYNSSPLLYYRLKMVDISGKSTYSQVQIIRMENDKNNVSILAYPNPTTDQLLISMPAAWHGSKAVAQIYTASGIMVKTVQLSNTSQSERMDVSQLVRGLYVINITCQNKTLQARMLKN